MPATLSDLPFELITEILIQSHCSSLFLVNRRLNSCLRAASNHDRAKYLLSASRTHFQTRKRGWSRVLDYCASFPICNHVVIKLINTWIVDQGALHSVLELPGPQDYRNLAEPHWPQATILSSKQFLPMYALPKRLFRSKDGKASTTYPAGYIPDVPPRLEDLFDDDKNTTWADPAEAPWWPLRCALSYIASADKTQIMPMPDLMLLLTLSTLHLGSYWPLKRALCPVSLRLPLAQAGGYPLTKAVFDKNFGLCSLLLAFGVTVDYEEGLAVTVACRQNWLDGLQLLTKRNKTEEVRWARARRILFWWILDRYEDGLDSTPSPLLRDVQRNVTPYKSDLSETHDDATEEEELDRRPTQAHYRALRERTTPTRSKHCPRGSTRASIRPYHVLEAFRHNSHQVAEYIMNQTDFKPSLVVIQEMEAFLDRTARRNAKRGSTQMLTDGGGDDEAAEEGDERKPTNKAIRI